MADLPVAGANAALQAILTPSTTYKLSLHAGDPGLTGANEVTGGSYARQSITFGNAASGVQASTSSQTYTSMPAKTIDHFGVWTSGGTFLCGGSIGSTIVANGQTVTVAIGAITTSIS